MCGAMVKFDVFIYTHAPFLKLKLCNETRSNIAALYIFVVRERKMRKQMCIKDEN